MFGVEAHTCLGFSPPEPKGENCRALSACPWGLCAGAAVLGSSHPVLKIVDACASRSPVPRPQRSCPAAWKRPCFCPPSGECAGASPQLPSEEAQTHTHSGGAGIPAKKGSKKWKCLCSLSTRMCVLFFFKKRRRMLYYSIAFLTNKTN